MRRHGAMLNDNRPRRSGHRSHSARRLTLYRLSAIGMMPLDRRKLCSINRIQLAHNCIFENRQGIGLTCRGILVEMFLNTILRLSLIVFRLRRVVSCVSQAGRNGYEPITMPIVGIKNDL